MVEAAGLEALHRRSVWFNRRDGLVAVGQLAA
jgi:hypothetical protein